MRARPRRTEASTDESEISLSSGTRNGDFAGTATLLVTTSDGGSEGGDGAESRSEDEQAETALRVTALRKESCAADIFIVHRMFESRAYLQFRCAFAQATRKALALKSAASYIDLVTCRIGIP